MIGNPGETNVVFSAGTDYFQSQNNSTCPLTGFELEQISGPESELQFQQ